MACVKCAENQNYHSTVPHSLSLRSPSSFSTPPALLARRRRRGGGQERIARGGLGFEPGLRQLLGQLGLLALLCELSLPYLLADPLALACRSLQKARWSGQAAFWHAREQ